MIKRIIFILITALCIVFTFSTVVYAKGDRQCKKPGCTRKAVPGPNRDGYCYEHSPKNKAVKCKVNGCTNKAYHGSIYCGTHECGASSCRNRKVSGTGFCSLHKMYQNHPAYSNNTGSSSSSNSEYEMPDCDDYDSFEEFMDDWDGCMPDGSDAEDYWDNW